VISGICDCVCVCMYPHSERKKSRAINTEFCTHIVHGTTSAYIHPGAKRSKFKVTRLSNALTAYGYAHVDTTASSLTLRARYIVSATYRQTRCGDRRRRSDVDSPTGRTSGGGGGGGGGSEADDDDDDDDGALADKSASSFSSTSFDVRAPSHGVLRHRRKVG